MQRQKVSYTLYIVSVRHFLTISSVKKCLMGSVRGGLPYAAARSSEGGAAPPDQSRASDAKPRDPRAISIQLKAGETARCYIQSVKDTCLFGLLAFMCTVHVFSPTFCGLSRRRLRGSELVRAWVRRMLRSPLPCGVPCGLERPLFRWRWRRVASLLAVGWCSVLASPFLAVRHWNSDSLALRSEKKKIQLFHV